MKKKVSLLIIEDEDTLLELLKTGLQYEGYNVKIAKNANQGLNIFFENKPELIILDIMLPDIDGFTVCRQIRNHDANIPIIMLTAKDAVKDKVEALNIGANDYLTKPFAFDELVARIKVQIRNGKTQTNILQIEDLVLDMSKKSVKRGQSTIELSSKEYMLLE